MSTAVIVIIAVAVLLLIAFLAMTAFSPRRRAERRLKAARQEAVTHHRRHAEERHSRAQVAEQRAEEARLEAERVQQEARLEREKADLHEGRADLHERGLADDELHDESRADLRDERDTTVPSGTEPREGRFTRSDTHDGTAQEHTSAAPADGTTHRRT